MALRAHVDMERLATPLCAAISLAPGTVFQNHLSPLPPSSKTISPLPPSFKIISRPCHRLSKSSLAPTTVFQSAGCTALGPSVEQTLSQPHHRTSSTRWDPLTTTCSSAGPSSWPSTCQRRRSSGHAAWSSMHKRQVLMSPSMHKGNCAMAL